MNIRVDRVTGVNQPLDGVGDFQFAPPGWRDRFHCFKDAGIEHIDAYEGEITGRVFWLLNQADDPAIVAPGVPIAFTTTMNVRSMSIGIVTPANAIPVLNRFHLVLGASS